MQRRSLLLAGLLAALVATSAMFAMPTRAAGTIAEVEPNNDCAGAQSIGSLDGSVTVHGDLLPYSPYPEPGTSQSPDYYVVNGQPGARVEVALSGASSGLGTLEFPFLGTFTTDESGCQPTNFASSGGVGNDARLVATLGSSGTLVIAVSSCCDYGFETGGLYGGTYQLTLTEAQPADAINGRLVDATSGAALPFRAVELHRCVSGGCAFYAYGATDAAGRFSFIYRPSDQPYPEPDPNDPPFSDNPIYLNLFSGDYQIIVSDFSGVYEPLISPVFSVTPGARVNLGDLALTPIPQGRSIQGRIVDAVSGEPLSGFGEPFASATLYRCSDFGCFNYVAFITPADDGTFTVTRDSVGLLPAGEYLLDLSASQYQFAQLGPFTLAADAELDLGDIELQSNPLRVTGATGCSTVPASGGICRYSIDVTNGQAQTVTLKGWSVINTLFNSNSAPSSFQPEPAQQLRLRPGETKSLRFQVNVPRSLAAGTLFCGDALVAPNSRDFYFSPQVRASVFCGTKDADGTFRQLPAEEAQLIARQMRGGRGWRGGPR